MSDLPYVSPGDKLIRSAGQWNALTDAARQTRQTDLTLSPRVFPRSLPNDQNSQILVQNLTADIEQRYAIVAYSGPVVDPSAGASEEASFVDEPILQASWPATNAEQFSWGVMPNPLTYGHVGRLIVSGVTPARLAKGVQVGDQVGIGSSVGDDILAFDPDGAATVISVAASDGDEFCWGVVRFGLHSAQVEAILLEPLEAADDPLTGQTCATAQILTHTGVNVAPCGVILDTTRSITIVNRSIDLAVEIGTYVIVTKLNREWRVIWADCGPSEISVGSVSSEDDVDGGANGGYGGGPFGDASYGGT